VRRTPPLFASNIRSVLACLFIPVELKDSSPISRNSGRRT
jgi:hypothetical protein